MAQTIAQHAHTRVHMSCAAFAFAHALRMCKNSHIHMAHGTHTAHTRAPQLVVPYLLRRVQENADVLKSVAAEKALIAAELRRRLLGGGGGGGGAA